MYEHISFVIYRDSLIVVLFFNSISSDDAILTHIRDIKNILESIGTLSK